MENSKISKKALLALGAVTLGVTSAQAANQNNEDLGSSVDVRSQMIASQSSDILMPFDAEAKCGEAKCGEKKEKSKESKCGESKCGEAKCGEKKSKEKKSKSKESKCGESKCGESKCGEG